MPKPMQNDLLDDDLDAFEDEENEALGEAAFAEGFGDPDDLDPGADAGDVENDPDPAAKDEKPRQTVSADDVVDELGDMTDEEIEAERQRMEDELNAPDAEEEERKAAENAEIERLKAENAELKNRDAANDKRLRTLEGRLGTLNSQFLNLAKTAGDDVERQGGDRASSADIKQAMASSAGLKELRENFPEQYDAMMEMAEILASRQGGSQIGENVIQEIARLREESEEILVTQRLEIVEDEHPDFLSLVGTEEGWGDKEFGEWYESQPADRRKAWDDTNKPRDTIQMLDEFKEFREWRKGLGEPGKLMRMDVLLERFAARDVESDPEATARARRDRQRLRNQRRLQRSTSPSGNRGAGAPRGQSDEEAFLDGFKNG